MNKFLLYLSFLTAISTFANVENNVKLISVLKDTNQFTFVGTPDLFQEKWDTLAQPNFWKIVMNMPPDSCLINVAKTRQVLKRESVKNWNRLTDSQKDEARTELRKLHNLPPDTRIFMTTGKNDFLNLPMFIRVFQKPLKFFLKTKPTLGTHRPY